MTGECVAGLLFEGLGASRRTRKSVQKLGAEEPQLKAALVLCPWLQMTLYLCLHSLCRLMGSINQS